MPKRERDITQQLVNCEVRSKESVVDQLLLSTQGAFSIPHW